LVAVPTEVDEVVPEAQTQADAAGGEAEHDVDSPDSGDYA
jgi:hypothetical protein